MSKKAIFLSERLDRIAPSRDRRYIAASGVLTAVCAALTAAVFALTALKTSYTVCTVLLCAAYASLAVSLWLIIKETIRNRFFSAVLFLVFAVTVTCACVAATVYFCIIY